MQLREGEGVLAAVAAAMLALRHPEGPDGDRMVSRKK